MTAELIICEHASPHYSPRTWHNAKAADLTIALALDFNTKGEQLTHRAANPRYLAVHLEHYQPKDAAKKILDDLAQWGLDRPVINIAGNGIYSLSSKGWDQQTVNQHLYDTLNIVHQHVPIARIISGGQTGVDLAGIVAAHTLGIPAVATLPSGFIQRNIGGQDRPHSMEEIVAMVKLGVDKIQASRIQVAATELVDIDATPATKRAPFKLRRR